MTKFTKFAVSAVALVAIFVAAKASATIVVPPTLKVGSTGTQVMNVQTVVGAVADGSFGPMTKAKVATWQSAHGLTVDGVVGPMTAAAMNGASGSGTLPAGCTSTSGFSPSTGLPCSGSTGGSTGPLAGTDGSISDVNELSQYSAEEVGEGQNDIKIVGFEVEASNDGDISISSARISFTITNASGSDNLDDYVDSIAVWEGSTKVGSADASDFSEDSGVYTKTVSFSNAVVKADDTEKFYITVDAAGSFDSGDIDSEVITADVENLRFKDGSGVTTTETGYDLDGMDVSVAFVSFSASADTELKISTSSSTPEADIVMVDDSSSTDGVVLLKGKLTLDGDSDIVIDEFPISFSPVGANINVMADSLHLVIDGEEYTESVPSMFDGSTASLTFDNLDFAMDAGDVVEFEVVADMTDMDGSIFAEGDTLEANVTASNRDLMDVENQEGDQLADSSEKSGTANGEAQEFRTEGIAVTLSSTSASVTAGNSASDDLGEFTIKFKVKAVGNTVYVSSVAAASLTTTGNGAIAGVERSGTATIGGVSVTVVNSTDSDMTANGNYEIQDGDEETFEMTTTVQLPTAGAAGQYRALLRALDWSVTDDAVIAGAGYTTNLDSFKTSYKALN